MCWFPLSSTWKNKMSDCTRPTRLCLSVCVPTCSIASTHHVRAWCVSVGQEGRRRSVVSYTLGRSRSSSAILLIQHNTSWCAWIMIELNSHRKSSLWWMQMQELDKLQEISVNKTMISSNCIHIYMQQDHSKWWLNCLFCTQQHATAHFPPQKISSIKEISS